MERWAMELCSPMVTAAPDLEWITTPSWMFELAPITIGCMPPSASTSSARITA